MGSVIGERVLLCRRDMNLNQTELGRRSGVSRAHISRIENGQVNGVTTDVLLALARALQTNAAYLLGLSDDAVTMDDGGEGDHIVAESTVTYEAETPDDRRLIESLLEVVRELSRDDLLFLLMMAEKLRKR